MRIALFVKYIPSRDRDNKSDMIWSTADGLKNAGFDVVLATQGGKERTDFPVLPFRKKGAPGLAFRLLKKILSTLRLREYLKEIREKEMALAVKGWMQRNGDIDVIIALCTANHPAVLAHVVASRLKIPLFVQEHKIYEIGIKSIQDVDPDYLQALRSADLLVAVSPQLVGMMKELGIRSDIGVIPNSLSDEFFHAPDTRIIPKWEGCGDISDDHFVYGGWTRWRAIKRIDLLLEAFKEVHSRNNATRLIVAGPIEPDSAAAWAAEYLKQNGLEDVVDLFGAASREQIQGIAHTVDCCVVPSDYETFGLPALEALAAGKPVVTTRCNGPEWLVRDHRFGRFVERGSPSALADAMVEVYRTRDEFDSDFIRSDTWNKYSRTAVASLWRNAIFAQVSNNELTR